MSNHAVKALSNMPFLPIMNHLWSLGKSTIYRWCSFHFVGIFRANRVWVPQGTTIEISTLYGLHPISLFQMHPNSDFISQVCLMPKKTPAFSDPNPKALFVSVKLQLSTFHDSLLKSNAQVLGDPNQGRTPWLWIDQSPFHPPIGLRWPWIVTNSFGSFSLSLSLWPNNIGLFSWLLSFILPIKYTIFKETIKLLLVTESIIQSHWITNKSHEKSPFNPY